MATVIRENVGLLNDKLTVKLTKEDYYPSFERAIKDYSKKANIPGFRKGMVPPGLVKKMYGASIFYDEVIKAVEKHMQQYLSEEKPDIFAQPLPLSADLKTIDMDSPSDYDFPFEIGLKPEIEIPALATSGVILHKVKVTDKMIDEEIEQQKKRRSKVNDAEEVTSQDNVLNVNIVETDDAGNPAENGISGDNSLLVSYFTLPFREQLMGKRKDDSIQLRLKDAFEEKEREWIADDLGMNKEDAAAMEKNFRMTITKIGIVEKKESNEEFFNAVFPGKEIKAEPEFRDQVRHQLQQQWDTQSRIQLHDQLYHILLDTPMDFPEEFLKKWMQKSGEKEKSQEEVESEFPGFKDQLKWTLIRDKIIRENNLEVTREELKEHMREEILQYFDHLKMDEDTSWVDSYIDRMMKDEKQVDRNYSKLITDKLFEWAQARVNPVEKEVTPEELTEMQHHHHH